MRRINTIESLRAVRANMKGSIGLVPTMGALHEGHLSLVQAAKSENDFVIVTIFINPTQFGPNEDYDAYPRDLDGDLRKLESVGVDYVFTPTPEIMYPANFQTYIDIGKISKHLEGASRPDHFRGVTTIVLKLLNLTQPTRAYFGQKDAQQVAVIRRMVHDLNVPVEVIPYPIVRETDGLAMSSRNRYLSPEQRKAALILSKSLNRVAELYLNGQHDPEVLRHEVRALFREEPLAQLDYVSLADAHTLEELDHPSDLPMLVSLTARVGSTRLLDNMLIPVELNSIENLLLHLGNPLQVRKNTTLSP